MALFRVEGAGLRLIAGPGAAGADRRAVRERVPLAESAPSTRAINEHRIVTCSSRAEFDAEFSWEARARLDAAGLEAVVAAPVRGGGGTACVLVLGWRRSRVFTAADLLVVNTAAAYTARAVDHVELVQHRLTVAREMQQAMLSDLPDVPGLTLAARYRPADTREYVGGDWYDGVAASAPARPGDPVVALSVGDIVGHELSATITMGQVRSMMRQAVWHRIAEPPSSAMHAFETANHGVGLHATGTAVLASLRNREPGSWTMSWVNAGHPLPILARPDGTARLLTGLEQWFGLPRGAVPSRRDRTVVVPEGSTLLLHTDGVIERRGHDVDRRTEALRRAVAGLAGSGPDHLVDAIMDDFGGGGDDDIVLLAVRFG